MALVLGGDDPGALAAALARCQGGDFSVEPEADDHPHRPPEGAHYRDLGFLDYQELGPPFSVALERLAAAEDPCAVVETSRGPVILRRMIHYEARSWSEGEYAASRALELRREAIGRQLRETLPAVIREAGLRWPLPPASGPPPADTIAVPGGLYWMGSTEEEIDQRVALYERYVAEAIGPAERRRYEDEVLHPVRVGDLRVDRTEVTTAAFRAFAARAGYRHVADLDVGDDRPVTQVTVADAMAYCAERGGRLPTAEEWEYVARGAEGRRFPWGDELPDGTRGNFCDSRCENAWATPDHDDGHGGLAPVGSYPAGATPGGVLDLSGNVREWTLTLTEDGKAWIKGGGFNNAYDDLIPADVRVQEWNRRSPDVGFRCVYDAD